MTMPSVYEGKCAIVTGGASGIGQALCRELAVRGAQAVIADVCSDIAGEVANEINASGGYAQAVELDVRNEAAFESIIKDAVTRYGQIDYMFNNAGIYNQSGKNGILNPSVAGAADKAADLAR